MNERDKIVSGWHVFPDGLSADEPGRAEGPVQQLVAAAAERTGPETQPDRAAPAVAPGKAVPISQLAAAIKALRNEASKMLSEVGGSSGIEATTTRGFAGGLNSACNIIDFLMEAQPDSEASDNERSGRRNAELCQPCPPSTAPRQETADGQGLA